MVTLATCALKRYLHKKCLLLFECVSEFLMPERIKYLYSEKLLTGSDWCIDFSLLHSLMSLFLLLGHSMGWPHPWVFHAPKVPLWAGADFKRTSFSSPNPAQARNIFLKRDLGRRPNSSNEWNMSIACLSTVMLLNVMFLVMLLNVRKNINGNATECKKKYHKTIKDGDMVLQNEPSRIAPKTWKPVYRSSFYKTSQESRKWLIFSKQRHRALISSPLSPSQKECETNPSR